MPSTAWYSQVQPGKAKYSLVQPSTAWYSQVQPGKAKYSLVQPSTAWYSQVQASTGKYRLVQHDTALFSLLPGVLDLILSYETVHSILCNLFHTLAIAPKA